MLILYYNIYETTRIGQTNVNLYCKHIKIGKCYTHLQNLYNIYPSSMWSMNIGSEYCAIPLKKDKKNIALLEEFSSKLFLNLLVDH